MILKVSTARNVPVLMIDSTDHVTGKSGLTLTIVASKDGGAFASISPTVTDLGSGWYNLALTTTHTNTQGALGLHITGSGADATDVLHEVCPDLPGAASLSTADKQSIADTIMARDSSNWETAAISGSKKNLGTAVMSAVHKRQDDGLGNLQTFKSDSVTSAFTQPIAVDGTLQPIREVDGTV
jgi:hypothetical protein